MMVNVNNNFNQIGNIQNIEPNSRIKIGIGKPISLDTHEYTLLAKDMFVSVLSKDTKKTDKSILEKMHIVKRLEIQVYSTYGTEDEVKVRGRVLENKELKPVKSTDSKFRNFVRNFKLFESDEEKNVSVNINLNGKTIKTKTDKEGFFEVKTKDFGHLPLGLNTVQVTLSGEQKKFIANPAIGKISIQPKEDRTFGIVSDIDDTIQKTEVTDKENMLNNILFKNAQTQKKIPGMAELFQALDKANDGKLDGDVTYVSGSPVNLSPRIEGFLQYNNFPEGTLELKNLGVEPGSDPLTKQIEYKLGRIRKLFDTYPDKKFILFGDSGEKDPEVYRQLSKEYPGRIISVYINNVTNDDKTASRYEGMLLTNNTSEAAADLFEKGMISSQDLQTVQKTVK